MTVEAALAVASLVVVLALVLVAMGALLVQVRCVDAAGEAARLASRDDPDGARRAALDLAPSGAEVSVDVRGEDVVARVRAPPLGSALPGLRVGAEATALREPGLVAPAEADATPADPDAEAAGSRAEAAGSGAEAAGPGVGAVARPGGGP